MQKTACRIGIHSGAVKHASVHVHVAWKGRDGWRRGEREMGGREKEREGKIKEEERVGKTKQMKGEEGLTLVCWLEENSSIMSTLVHASGCSLNW